MSGSSLGTLFSKRYMYEDIPDQRGKVAIVTGGSAGIGYGISLGLALAGCKVHIVSATPEHGKEAVESINSQVQSNSTGSPKFPSGSATHHVLDLGSLKDVERFGEKITKELAVTRSEGIKEDGLGNPGEREGELKGGLDYLICDAGVGVAPFGLTKDGLGNHFAINHLSHMLLTDTLLPLLQSTAAKPTSRPGDVRIVVMSSELHRSAPSDVEFKDVEEMNQEDRDANVLYSRSKLMNILFTKQLAKRKLEPEGNKIVAIATHPGAVATGQQEGAEQAYGALGTVLKKASTVLFKSPEQGAESALWAATSPKVSEDVKSYQGSYLRQPDDSLGSESNQAMDERLAENLWNLSKKVIREKTGREISY